MPTQGSSPAGSDTDEGQVQSKQQHIKACIARVEGDRNKGDGESGAPLRLGRSME